MNATIFTKLKIIQFYKRGECEYYNCILETICEQHKIKCKDKNEHNKENK